MWRRLSKVNQIVQRSKDNVDQYYQFQKSEIIKAEQLMKDKYGTLYQIPEPMNIHCFLEGLKNDSIKQKLYTEELTTWEEYYHRASLLEQSSPN